MKKYELILFLMIYIDILNGKNEFLIKEIFDIFDLTKIEKPLNSNVLTPYIEKVELIYRKQDKIIEQIKKISLCNFTSYLIKFYTIHLNLYVVTKGFDNCEIIMKDLKDNSYDNLIFGKLYLSEYS